MGRFTKLMSVASAVVVLIGGQAMVAPAASALPLATAPVTPVASAAAAAAVSTSTKVTLQPNARAYSGAATIADIWVTAANKKHPGGDVLVWSNSKLLARGKVNAYGHARLALPRTMLPGTYSMKVRFAPAGTGYLPSLSAPAVLSIAKDRTAVAISGNATTTVGSTGRLDIGVASPTGGAGKGSVDILINGKKVATRKLNAAGRTWYMIPTDLKAGRYQLIAAYSGWSTMGVSKAGRIITVNKATPSVQSVVSATTVNAGSRPLMSVAVSGGAVKPTGTVKIVVDGAVVATKTLTGGVFTVQLPAMSAGQHSVYANYSGDGRYSARNGARHTITVRAPNPCSPTARACVDLTNDLAWIQSGGQIVYGPVPITSGRPGYRTNAGMFSVYWKDRDHKSSIFNDAPMPNSVFFDGGIAFHAGSVYVWSHGCIHLEWAASEYFYNNLDYGDTVHVFGYAPY